MSASTPHALTTSILRACPIAHWRAFATFSFSSYSHHVISMRHNLRFFHSSSSWYASKAFVKKEPHMRNIGISAHIDSGKTTCTERVLFYTGKIQRIHEVKGGDNIGATMDSMELEKERGITIRSAATFCRWNESLINIIDTPGHVDFTIEVERALRVLDGGVLLVCGVSGVQTQTLTVDKQMRRYNVPRVCFINKLDRDNANPQRALEQIRSQLKVNAAFIFINIGLSQDFEGLIDIVNGRAVYFDGPNGENVRYDTIPDYMEDEFQSTRKELIARLADNDPVMEDNFLNETIPTTELFEKSIREQTIANYFVPVIVGSAYKNKGIQMLLNSVEKYLPSPRNMVNKGFTMKNVSQDGGATIVTMKDKEVVLETDDEKPLVALIFKLEETKKSGFSNYVRVYQGKMRKENLVNVRTGKTFTVRKLVRMHADNTEDVEEASAGEICAIIGDIDASSGDTIMRAAGTKSADFLSCEDMYVPPRVISESVKPVNDRDVSNMQNRMKHFMREDPTFNFTKNNETNEFIIEGMGELHLDVYVERCKREFDLPLIAGKPTVNYREIIRKREEFDFVYRRQSGGAGQWAHVKGYLEPLNINLSAEKGLKNLIDSSATNSDIKESLQKSFIKHFQRNIFPQGLLMGAPLWGLHIHLNGGAMHEVDSTDIAFRNCAQELWELMLPKLEPTLIEPYMRVEIACPTNYTSDVTSEFTKRGGIITEQLVDGDVTDLRGETALDLMFGFINDLRKLTKGLGQFSMEFADYRAMPTHKAQQVMNERNTILDRKLYHLQG